MNKLFSILSVFFLLLVSFAVSAEETMPSPEQSLAIAQENSQYALVVAYGYNGWKERTILDAETRIEVVPQTETGINKIKSFIPVIGKQIWIENNVVYVSQFLAEKLPVEILAQMIQAKAKPGLTNAFLSAMF